ncbi:MAG: YdcF family protein [candidate division KSB1 bacterium]|nr:YdcF family protein [candidate division KSB1 bacterium]
MHGFLDIGKEPKPADSIFVFAGRPERKTYGYELYQRGLADRIIFSVGRFEWRAFLRMFPENTGGLYDLVQTTYYKDRHFFVIMDRHQTRSVRVQKQRLGTYTEIKALIPLLTELHVQRLMVVTSDFHLRRAVEILRSICKGRNIDIFPVAVPENCAATSEGGLSPPAPGKRLIVHEFVKYVAYKAAAPVFRWLT